MKGDTPRPYFHHRRSEQYPESFLGCMQAILLNSFENNPISNKYKLGTDCEKWERKEEETLVSFILSLIASSIFFFSVIKVFYWTIVSFALDVGGANWLLFCRLAQVGGRLLGGSDPLSSGESPPHMYQVFPIDFQKRLIIGCPKIE